MQKHVTNFDRTVAANIKRLRIDRKLTQPRVAEALGIKYQSYQKLEGGKTSIRAKTLWTLSELFVVSIDQLVHGVEAQLPNSKQISDVAARMAALPARDANAVVDYAYHIKHNPMMELPETKA